jgi:hypothetical protein
VFGTASLPGKPVKPERGPPAELFGQARTSPNLRGPSRTARAAQPRIYRHIGSCSRQQAARQMDFRVPTLAPPFEALSLAPELGFT